MKLSRPVLAALAGLVLGLAFSTLAPLVERAAWAVAPPGFILFSPDVSDDWVKARVLEYSRGAHTSLWKPVDATAWRFHEVHFGAREFRYSDGTSALVFVPEGDGHVYAWTSRGQLCLSHDALSLSCTWSSVERDASGQSQCAVAVKTSCMTSRIWRRLLS